MEPATVKATLLETLRAERARWEALLAEVGEARMTQAGVEGDWSVKDLIAHVTWCEAWVLAGVRQYLRGEPVTAGQYAGLSTDERNARIFAEHRLRPLADVRADAGRTFADLLDAVAALGEADLTEPQRWPALPAGRRPWEVVAGETYLHYRLHGRAIRAWLDRQATEAAQSNPGPGGSPPA